jgi:hypothetical protein
MVQLIKSFLLKKLLKCQNFFDFRKKIGNLPTNTHIY